MENNLRSQEALAKLKELAEDIRICMFITKPEDEQSSRPMATTKAEDDGTLWFYTKISSGKTAEIEEDQDVHLVYSDPGKDKYMDLWGTSRVVTDKEKIKEYWNPMVKAWFPKGVDDPEICLLKVNPTTAHYWEAKSGKMIQFFQMIASALTGKQLVEGEEGTIRN